jgi:hypothetical protein
MLDRLIRAYADSFILHRIEAVTPALGLNDHQIEACAKAAKLRTDLA